MRSGNRLADSPVLAFCGRRRGQRLDRQNVRRPLWPGSMLASGLAASSACRAGDALDPVDTDKDNPMPVAARLAGRPVVSIPRVFFA